MHTARNSTINTQNSSKKACLRSARGGVTVKVYGEIARAEIVNYSPSLSIIVNYRLLSDRHDDTVRKHRLRRRYEGLDEGIYELRGCVMRPTRNRPSLAQLVDRLPADSARFPRHRAVECSRSARTLLLGDERSPHVGPVALLVARSSAARPHPQ